MNVSYYRAVTRLDKEQLLGCYRKAKIGYVASTGILKRCCDDYGSYLEQKNKYGLTKKQALKRAKKYNDKYYRLCDKKRHITRKYEWHCE